MPNQQTWKIYYDQLDSDGNVIGHGLHPTEFVTRLWAANIAHKTYGNRKKYRYKVDQRDPHAEYLGGETCPICGGEFIFQEDSVGRAVDGHYVMLSIMKDGERTSFTRLICPTCGEQLRICMDTYEEG